MRIITKDSGDAASYGKAFTPAGDGLIAFDADDNRIAAFRHFFAANPGLLGLGAWDQFGRRAADATEALAFSVSQLAFVEAKTYLRQYLPMRYEELLGNTISYAAGEWAQTIEYQIVDYIGMGRRLSAAGQDMPLADVAAARKSYNVAQGGIGYAYNTEDLRVSAYLKRPLPTEKLFAAMTGFRRHMNFVALQGEVGSNFKGLYNSSLVTAANRPSGAVWTAATADTMISDITAGISAIKVATVGNDKPTTIVMPISSKERLQIPRASASDTTVEEFIRRIYPGLNIVADDTLATLGAGATKRVVFFNPDDENMIFHIPMPQKFLAPQLEDLRIKVPGEYKYAGLEIRRPPTAYYMDGV